MADIVIYTARRNPSEAARSIGNEHRGRGDRVRYCAMQFALPYAPELFGKAEAGRYADIVYTDSDEIAAAVQAMPYLDTYPNHRPQVLPITKAPAKAPAKRTRRKKASEVD